MSLTRKRTLAVIGRHLRTISAERHGGYAYAAERVRGHGKAVGNR